MVTGVPGTGGDLALQPQAAHTQRDAFAEGVFSGCLCRFLRTRGAEKPERRMNRPILILVWFILILGFVIVITIRCFFVFYLLSFISRGMATG
ncbi:hypothetical protein SFC43_13960 [Bacteroides sp. CR5/BHMF/2]|nr:hypothetical protein [Bacteroides sp. CR5/BHMF/2]